MSAPAPLDAGLRRTWCRIDLDALAHNLRVLRLLVGHSVRLAPIVKANAYGHGMLLAARAFVDAGADWLCVDALHEAIALRQAGFELPILVVGHVPAEQAPHAVHAAVRLVAYDADVIEALSAAAVAAGAPRPTAIHLKLETGTHRQGVELDEALALADRIRDLPGVTLGGVSSHFANIEDTTDHSVARAQLACFDRVVEALRARGHEVPIRSMANSAASLLWPEAHFELVRPGIAVYGMWPSRETFLSALLAGRHQVELRPAMTWCTRIAQIKDVPAGCAIGYGCTFRTTHRSRIAILPVGYYDGFDRGLSNLAHVLVRGQRAPLRGRVCMNMVMVDVTDVPNAVPGDEVVLLGRQGDELLSAEQLADWAGTINYEITTRICEAIPRIPAQP